MKNCLRIISLLYAVIILHGCRNGNDIEQKYIKIGSASVTVKLVDGDMAWPDSVSVYATEVTILNPEETYTDPFELNKVSDNEWSGEVPMEINTANTARFCVLNNDRSFELFFNGGLSQDTPLSLIVKRNGDNDYSIESEGGSGINDGIGVVAGFATSMPVCIDWQFTDVSNNNRVSIGVYASKSWETYIKSELDTVLPARLNYAFADYNLPPDRANVLAEQMKRLYYKGRIVHYVDNAKRFADTDVPEPPVEFYKAYIDSMSFTPEIMLDECYDPTMLVFLKLLLHNKSINVPDIAENDIADWIAASREEVGKIVTNPSDMFMDLLSAAAYLHQVEADNKTLTNLQKQNINKYYTDDLGKIILRRNETVARQLAGVCSDIEDLTSETEAFDLDKYIERFNGKPVVVDLWNTWCAPCRNAMQQLEPEKSGIMAQGVEFLYIAGASSPEKDWRSLAERESGTHVRLSDDNYGKLLDKYGINAIPSYLFFDSDHKLVESYTGFPGIDGFKESINRIAN